MTLRLVVADDEPLVRQGLVAILGTEPGFEVVGEAADGVQAVTVVRRLRPDVVCMDVRMPDVDGIRATELVLALPDPPKVLVVTTFSSDDSVLAALRAGAAGFVLKRATVEELVAAVRAVAAGDGLLYPAVVGQLALRSQRPSRYSGPPLTLRESQVLALLADGSTNAEVAARLVIGVETVRTHVAAVLRKLAARDRTHAAVLAHAYGLLGPPTP